MIGRALIALAAGLALAGCVRVTQPMGPPVAEPALAMNVLVAADGYRLPLQIWAPEGEPRAVILALHGFDDYAEAFARPATAWAAQGIATYAYDQRGFGRTARPGVWAGSDTMVADARAAAALLRRRYPRTPLFLLGESMGGAVAIEAVTAAPPAPVDGVILVSPAAWARTLMPGYQQAALWLSTRMVPGLMLSGEGLNIWPTDNYDVLRQMSQDPLVLKINRLDAIDGLVDLMSRAYADAPRMAGPVLVLFGAHEQVLPPEAVQGLLARLPRGAVTAEYPQGYHMLLRDRAGALPIGDIASWIADRSAPLPSGAERRGRAAAP